MAEVVEVAAVLADETSQVLLMKGADWWWRWETME